MFKFGSSSKQETQYTDDRKPVNKEQKPGRNWKTFWRQKPSRSTEMATAGGAGNNSDGRRGHHKRKVFGENTNADVVKNKIAKKEVPAKHAKVTSSKVKRNSIDSGHPSKELRRKKHPLVDIPIPKALQHAGNATQLDMTSLKVALEMVPMGVTPVTDLSLTQDMLGAGCLLNDVTDYLREREQKVVLRDFLTGQKEVTANTRAVLVDWLIQVQHFLKCETETLHLAVTLLDLFLATYQTTVAEVQLLGITCLLIAAKFNERFPPEIEQLTHLTDDTYTHSDVLRTERKILKKLGFIVNYPVPMDFMHLFINVAGYSQQLENLTQYFLDLSLTDSYCKHYKPSLLTAGAVYLARRIVNASEDSSVVPGCKAISSERSLAREIADVEQVMQERYVSPDGRRRMSTTSVQYSRRHSGARRMSVTLSENNNSRRVSIIVESQQGRRMSITFSNDTRSGERKLSVVAADNDDDVFGLDTMDNVLGSWSHDLRHYTTYTEQEVLPVAQRLAMILASSETSRFQGAKSKYSSRRKFNAISMWEELKTSPVLDEILNTRQLPTLCSTSEEDCATERD